MSPHSFSHERSSEMFEWGLSEPHCFRNSQHYTLSKIFIEFMDHFMTFLCFQVAIPVTRGFL